MNRSRIIYYILFPLVVFGLCAFSYFLGLNRGRQLVSLEEGNVLGESSSTHHDGAAELTFFKTLKEGGNEPQLVSSPKPPTAVAKSALPTVVDHERKIGPHAAVIQMSAFQDIGKAHELVDSLKSQGFSAFERTTKASGVLWHRVYVGPYESKTSALPIVESLMMKGFKKGFVTQLEKP